jgi:hypothetical protein
MNNGEMTPARNVSANEGKYFFCGSYIFKDVFILLAIPMISTNSELVGLFCERYCKLVRIAINQSTSVLTWV